MSRISPLFPRRIAVLALLVSVVSAVFGEAALAQPWQGFGRAQGVVRDSHGSPLEAARVTLRLDSDPEEGPASTFTDQRGRWALIGLAGGRWRLTIEREGYDAVSGWLQVAAEGPSPSSDVQMHALSEVLPLGAESNPRVVYDWLGKGNALLDQGKAAEARAEYLKAVKVLDSEQLAPIWSAIARTYYLEKDHDRALVALKRAVLAAPAEAEARRLLIELASGLARSPEATEWLARLDREGSEALAEELGPVFRQSPEAQAYWVELERMLAAPPDPPSPDRLGQYKTAFSESSPWSGIEVFSERYGIPLETIAKADPTGGRYELAKESYEVLVPENYRRERPAGLFVWVAPVDFGGDQRGEILEALSELNLIWVGANKSGNPRPKWNRIGLALDAAHNLKKLYAIDPERVYIGGYSGGGRISSAVAMVYPEVFQGAFCYMAVDYFRKVPRPDKPGTYWPQAFPSPERDLARALKREHAWVLVTGEKDYNRTQTRSFFAEYQKDGFENVTLIEIPGASHYDDVTGVVLKQGITALDGRAGHRQATGSRPQGGSSPSGR